MSVSVDSGYHFLPFLLWILTDLFFFCFFFFYYNSTTSSDLVKKLWHMTGYKNLHPDNGILEGLQNLQTISQQISIERAHQMEVHWLCFFFLFVFFFFVVVFMHAQ